MFSNINADIQTTSSDGQVSYLVPAAITDTGCERELNEDRYAVIESPSGIGWFVCDGMGGASGGELAAQLAIDAIRRSLESSPCRNPEIALREAISEANRVIVLRRQNQAFANMGTTVLGVVIRGDELAIAHVGDSRAYLIRDDSIQQITHDHTLVQEMVDKGDLLQQDALSHPQAHILTKCLGSEIALGLDPKTYWIWQTLSAQGQDFLLLCTDGLYSLVDEDEMANLVSSNTPQDACVQLVELAKQRGGFDNITLAVLPIGGHIKERPQIRESSSTQTGDVNSPSPWLEVLKIVAFMGILSIVAILSVLFVVFYSIRF